MRSGIPAACEPDREIRAFLRRHPAQKRQVRDLRSGVELVTASGGDAMRDGREPAGAEDRQALRIRDRHEAEARPARENTAAGLSSPAARAASSPFSRRAARRSGSASGRCESAGCRTPRAMPTNQMQLIQVRREVGFEWRLIEPERLLANGLQMRLRSRVAACEEGDVVSEIDQGVTQVCNDPLRSAVKLRRHRFIKRSNLCDFHARTSMFSCNQSI